MSSVRFTSKPEHHTGAKRPLQRLRREAGYRSARELAERLNIPPSTYARYERTPEGPDCGIPLSNAWAIADALGCSIDAVVGREDIDRPKETTLDERAARLSRNSRATLDDMLDFLEARDAADASMQRRVAR